MYWVGNSETYARFSEWSSLRQGWNSGNRMSSQNPVLCPAPCDKSTRTVATGVNAIPIARGHHQWSGASVFGSRECDGSPGAYGFNLTRRPNCLVCDNGAVHLARANDIVMDYYRSTRAVVQPMVPRGHFGTCASSCLLILIASAYSSGESNA